MINTFWTRLSKVLFPKRSVKMIDGSEKCNRQLAFELRNWHVFEKHSKRSKLHYFSHLKSPLPYPLRKAWYSSYCYLIPVNDRKWDNNNKNSNQRCPETLLYLSKEARFFSVWNSCVAVTPVSFIIMHPWCTWVLQEKEAARLAQSVEQLTAERDVVGLIPRAGPIHSIIT